MICFFRISEAILEVIKHWTYNLSLVDGMCHNRLKEVETEEKLKQGNKKLIEGYKDLIK